mgnify:CR=1 FL=1
MQIIKFDLNDMEKKQDGFSCYILDRSSKTTKQRTRLFTCFNVV